MQLSGFRFQFRVRKYIIGLVFLLTLFYMFSVANPSLAVTEDPGATPEGYFTLKVNINGQIFTVASYGISAMKDFPQVQRLYSSVDLMPAPDITLAQGVLLTDLLGRSNIDFTNVQSIKLSSSDGWSHSYSKSYLFGATRYYYPNLVAAWDKITDKPPAFLSGVEDNKSPVEPILALSFYHERFGSGTAWDKLSGADGLRFCFGQKEPAEGTDPNFGKNINQMEVVLNDGSPFISLSLPKAGQSYQPGTTMNLNGKAKNLTAVTSSVTGPDGTTVCPEKNLDVVGGAFATDFVLPGNTAEGVYSIMISKPGKPSMYIATFKFQVSKANISVQPGDYSFNAHGSAGTPVIPGDQGKLRVGGSGSTAPPADTLTIKVGYYGEPYVIKKVFILSEFNALPQVRQAYTLIDAMPAVVIDSVIKGVKLSDVLASAGIDLNSVQTFYFYTNDVTQKWYQSLSKSFLYAPRFYYPNLPTHWDGDNAIALPGSADGAISVEPVLAAIDNWRRLATAPDFDDPDNSTRFRLLFGQLDSATPTASRSAKWINTIEVLLGGTPPKGVTLDKNTLNLKVGSTFTLTASVQGDDPSTVKSVTWSSSDPEVAKVDENGQVTIVGQGTSSITVTTVAGKKTAICVVNAPNQAPNSTNIPKIEPSAAVDALARSAVQPWRVYEMSAEAVPMLQQKQSSRMNTYIAAISLLLFLCGSVRKFKEYIREVAK